MADSVEEASQASVSNLRRKAGKQSKMQKVVSSHPKVSEMVNSAILNLKERNGSSLQAIKKYIATKYAVDVDKLASFIRKYLKISVANGTLIQTKGKGASGSFKLGGTMKMEKSETKPQKSTPAKAKSNRAAEAKPKVVKEKIKKSKSPKKSTKEKVRKTPTKAKAPKPKKAPSKSAKPTKAAPKQETSGETAQTITLE